MSTATIASAPHQNQQEQDLYFARCICNQLEELLAQAGGLDAPSHLFGLIEYHRDYVSESAFQRMHEMRMIRNNLAHKNKYRTIRQCPSVRRIKSRSDFERAFEYAKSEIEMAENRRLRHEQKLAATPYDDSQQCQPKPFRVNGPIAVAVLIAAAVLIEVFVF